MGKVWVLDSETKGTGAQVVPLEKVLKKGGAKGEPLYVPPKREPRPAKEPEARPPRRFRIVRIVSAEVLAGDVGTRAAVELLEDVESIVDVRVYVWRPETEAWRLLTLGEQRLLWDLRGRRGDAAGDATLSRDEGPTMSP